MRLKIISSIVFLLLFTGCAPKNNESVFQQLNKYNLNLKTQQNNKIEEIVINKKEKKQKINLTPPPVMKNGVKIKNFHPKILVSGNKQQQKLAVSVENIPLPEFIKLVYGQILRYNYTMSDNVSKIKKTVTLKMNEKVPFNEFISIVNSILNSNGVVVKRKNGIYYIEKGKQKQIKKLSDYIIYGRSIPNTLPDNQIVTVIVPSYYIDLTNIEWMIKRFYLSSQAYVVDYRQKNVMFITDKVSYLKAALNFINLMDTPTLKNKYTSIIKLKYIDVGAFIKRLDNLLPASGVKIAKSLNDLGILLKPIPEINSVLIVSDKRKWIDLVKFWKNKLDILNLNSQTPQIFIYTPQNRKSDELAKLVKSLFGGNMGAVKSSKNKKTVVKQKAVLKVINDAGRNRLIIYTTPKMYKKIYTMLRKLDVLPKQVLIQVTIAEITLKNSLQYGFEWFLQHQGGSSYNLGTLGNLGIGGGGLVGSVINTDQTFQAIMNFLAQKNLINILSSPKLLVLNNQSATINVGTQVPVLTSSTTSQNTDTGSTQVTQSVQYRNTGIILNVKPTIHSNGTLTLNISQTVSDPQPNNTSNISSPMILNRSINTNVIIKSNQALLLGGLIKQTTGKTINKIPLLGDIPWIGNFFKTVSYSKDKTELIILVKPIILSNDKESNEITQKFKNLILNSQ